MRLVYAITIAILIFCLSLIMNNKSFSTLLLLTECVLFSLVLVTLTLYNISGMDYYVKALATILFLFSFELSIIITLLYSLKN